MGQAQTGTGKTAAFAIPILERLKPHRKAAPPQAIVLVPTRELAVQVRDECVKLAEGRHVHIVAVYGGKPIRKQTEQLAQGAALVVGTPGRVLDLIGRGALVLGDVRFVVLDEADRMLDIGFRPDIEKILRRCPQSRQTLLLERHDSPAGQAAGRTLHARPRVAGFLRRRTWRSRPSSSSIAPSYPEQKFDLLVRLLEREKPSQAIIFCRTKRGTEKVHRRLRPSLQGRGHDPRRPGAKRARPGDAGVSRGQGPLAGGHRRRRPRHRRQRHLAHHQLRHPAVLRRLRASRGPHRPHGPRRRRLHLRHARRKATS